MRRTVIQIDEEKCNGCGICADACHEGAIGMVNGKAKLLRDDYCDGLGDCLPACPTDAITFVEREAVPYDATAGASAPGTLGSDSGSQLGQWPCQIKLVSPNARFFQGADLLIAADCTAFSCGDFHQRYMRDRVAIIGCPKLDGIDYADKLTEIFAANDIRSITVVLMEVPCCNGLGSAVNRALASSGKDIPLTVDVVSLDGHIL